MESTTMKQATDKRRLGSAAVELAVALPFLCIIMVGMMEYGRAIMLKHALTDCARQACRSAILPGQTDTMVRGEIADILTRNFGATVASARPDDTIMVGTTYSGYDTSTSPSTTTTDTLVSSVRGDKITVQVK